MQPENLAISVLVIATTIVLFNDIANRKADDESF